MGDAQKDLRAAWDDLIAELERARDAIDQPELMPAPSSDRNLAEGYRYLAGFVHGAIERAFHGDPRFPAFRNALSIKTKATIDNADAIYFMAPIDGRESIRRARKGRRSPPLARRAARGDRPPRAAVPDLRALRRLPRRRLGQSRRAAAGREGADGPARLVRSRGGRGRQLRDPARARSGRPATPATSWRHTSACRARRPISPTGRSTAMRAGSAAASSSTTGSARIRRRSRSRGSARSASTRPPTPPSARPRSCARWARSCAGRCTSGTNSTRCCWRSTASATAGTRPGPASASCRATRSTSRTRRRVRPAAARAPTSTRAACSSSSPTRR